MRVGGRGSWAGEVAGGREEGLRKVRSRGWVGAMVFRILILAVAVAFTASGCSSLSAEGARADLARAARVFVEQRLNDNHGLDRALVAELRALGYEAESGPLTMMPERTQLVVTYDAREEWDFRAYLIEFNVAVRPADNYHRIVASGRYFRPGLTTKAPAEMVREVVTRVFPPRVAAGQPE